MTTLQDRIRAKVQEARDTVPAKEVQRRLGHLEPLLRPWKGAEARKEAFRRRMERKEMRRH